MGKGAYLLIIMVTWDCCQPRSLFTKPNRLLDLCFAAPNGLVSAVQLTSELDLLSTTSAWAQAC
eukprot:1139743-Pelagomonas_calceolata.AAC.8